MKNKEFWKSVIQLAISKTKEVLINGLSLILQNKEVIINHLDAIEEVKFE